PRRTGPAWSRQPATRASRCDYEGCAPIADTIGEGSAGPRGPGLSKAEPRRSRRPIPTLLPAARLAQPPHEPEQPPPAAADDVAAPVVPAEPLPAVEDAPTPDPAPTPEDDDDDDDDADDDDDEFFASDFASEPAPKPASPAPPPM